MKKYLIFLVLSIILYSLHFAVSGHGVYGDGNGYFALTHTLFFQPNLDLHPVYRYLGEFHGPRYVFSRIFWSTAPTRTGVLNCPWLVGPSFFWLPSFFLTYFLSLVSWLHIGRFSFLYEYGCGLTGIGLMLGGLFFIEQTLKRDFPTRIASLAVVTIFAGSQVFYYAAFEPALAHQASFFLISMILYLVHRNEKSPQPVFLMGLSAGLLAITRMGEVVLVAVPVGMFLLRIVKKKAWRLTVLFTVSLIAGLLPQLLLQKAMYGSYLYNPYLHADKGVLHPILFSSLWNHLLAARGGFLLWSPVFILALFGTFAGLTRNKPMVIVYAVSLAMYYILISSWEYIPPAGFGNRFLISTIPFLGYGMAYFFLRYRKFAPAIIVFSISWNILLLGQFYTDSRRIVDGKGLTVFNLVTGQVTVPLRKTGFLRF